MSRREGQVVVFGQGTTIWLHKAFAWDKTWSTILKEQLQPWLYKRLIETGNWDGNANSLIDKEAIVVKTVAEAAGNDGKKVPVVLLYIDAIDRYVLAADTPNLLIPAKHKCRRCGRERTGPDVCWLCGHP